MRLSQIKQSGNRLKEKLNNGFGSVVGLGAASATTGVEDMSDFYEDELVGSGPTYTIASFNCANVVQNVKNRTINKNQGNLGANNNKERMGKRERREAVGEASGTKPSSQEILANDIDSYVSEEIDYNGK